MSTNYVTKLAIYLASRKAVPDGGGLFDGVAWLKDKERMKADMKACFAEAQTYIDAVKAAPDNTYGDDDQAIAKAILDAIEERRSGRKA